MALFLAIVFLFSIGLLLFLASFNKGPSFAVQEQQFRRISEAAEQKFDTIVSEHLDTLYRRRIILITKNPYGVVNRTAWDSELDEFLFNAVDEKFEPFEARALELKYKSLEKEVDRRIDEYAVTRDRKNDLPADLTPLDFEASCCAVLADLGWDAHVTKGSGDQGADVVATKDSQRLVVQCKLYSGTVGNKAVQEVLAAKNFYGADHAAVVCTTGYTKAAQQLAQSSDVALLMYHDLRDHVATL